VEIADVEQHGWHGQASQIRCDKISQAESALTRL
jgi:hypothetical protein